MIPVRTLIVHGRLAMRETRLARACGTTAMSFNQAAARLAGGFASPIDPDALKAAIHRVLPQVDLGPLEPIKVLPA